MSAGGPPPYAPECGLPLGAAAAELANEAASVAPMSAAGPPQLTNYTPPGAEQRPSRERGGPYKL